MRKVISRLDQMLIGMKVRLAQKKPAVDQIIIMFIIIAVAAGIAGCQTAHCGRRKPHFDFGRNTSPIVPYRHLPQTLRGLPADCRSLV